MSRRLATVLIGLLAASACKMRNDQSIVQDADVPAAPPGGGIQAASPLAGAQFGAAAFATGSCFGGTAATWSDAGNPAFASPELVPPGSIRFVHPNKMTSTYQGWTRNIAGANSAVEVFDTRVDKIDDFVSRLSSGDQGAINWHLGRGFGPALASGMGDVAAASSFYGVVVLRKVMANQQLSAAAASPQGVQVTSQSYTACGDGYLTGQVFADNFLLLVVADAADKRDTATDLVRNLATSAGDFDQTLAAATAAIAGTTQLFALENGTGGLRLASHGAADGEAAMNTWRMADASAGVTGIPSLLGAVQLYPGYTDGDPSSAQLNSGLATLALGRDSLRGMEATAKATKQQQLTTLAGQIQTCGGLRFGSDGTGPAASCSQLRGTAIPTNRISTINLSDSPLTGSNGPMFNMCFYSGQVSGQPQRHAGRAEFTAVMQDPALKQRIYSNYFYERWRGQRETGPGFTAKYEYFWVRPASTDTGRVIARIEDKRTTWSDDVNSNGGTNPHPFTADYPFEVTFLTIADHFTDYTARDLCINPIAGEPVPTAVETAE